MVVTTFIGGIFMVGVQVLAIRMRKTDFNNFVALLGLLVVFGGVPAAALQTIFAQQAAAAVTGEKRADLTATARALLRSTFIFWLVVAGLALIFVGPVSAALGVNNPAAVRLVMLCVLPSLWGPILKGLLQGEHRFAPLGWLLMLEGVVRIGTFVLLVMILKGGAAAGFWAVFTGLYLTMSIALWLTREVWSGKSTGAFSWREWLARGAPLTMGMGAYVFMTRLDNVFTKSLFYDADSVKLYNCAMFMGFAITQFISPITAVMFPTIVRNLALSKKTDALALTLAVTGGFGCLAAVGCTVFPKLPLAILHFDPGAAPLVPWFAWAVLPLTLAYVLIQNLLAQGRYAAAPWLILVPVLYGLTLMAQGPALVRMFDSHPFDAFERVIQTLGLFCLLLFAVAGWFTWRRPSSPRPAGAGI